MKILIMIALAAAMLTGCGTNTTPDKTDSSCITALDTAEKLVHGPITAGNQDELALIKLINKAYDAGVTGDAVEIQDVADTLNRIAASTRARTVDITALVKTYNHYSALCRGLDKGQTT